MPDIFDEVEEDLRAERARRFAARYGILFLLAAVLIVAGVGGWEIWRGRQATRAADISARYLAATAEADAPVPNRDAATRALDEVIADGTPTYRVLARMRLAAIKVTGGDLAGASALWDQVAADADADPLLVDLANLEWALHHVDSGDPEAVYKRLAPLSVQDRPWHALAEEATAMLDLRLGKTDSARERLERLRDDTLAPQGVRGRANGLIAQLGGASK